MSGSLAIVIGASRGVGLAIAKELRDSGYTLLATSRGAAPQLEELGVEVVTGVDITADESFQSILTKLGDRQIRLLVISSGIQEFDTFETVTKASIYRQLDCNAVGPLFAVKALQHKLEHRSKVVLISSKNASIALTEATGGELYAYRMSKVALNAVGRTLAIDLKRLNESSVAMIHPGVVHTDMLVSLRRTRGVPEDQLTKNTLTPAESAAGVRKLIDGLTLENSGSYWTADTGKVVEW